MAYCWARARSARALRERERERERAPKGKTTELSPWLWLAAGRRREAQNNHKTRRQNSRQKWPSVLVWSWCTQPGARRPRASCAFKGQRPSTYNLWRWGASSAVTKPHLLEPCSPPSDALRKEKHQATRRIACILKVCFFCLGEPSTHKLFGIVRN